MQIPSEFFTIQSMLTLTGATGATFVVSNGCQAAFNFNPRWLALAVAMAISMFGVHKAGGHGSDYFIGLVNGFLIYCTTAGATSVVGSTPPNEQGKARDATQIASASAARRTFLTRWV